MSRAASIAPRSPSPLIWRKVLARTGGTIETLVGSGDVDVPVAPGGWLVTRDGVSVSVIARREDSLDELADELGDAPRATDAVDASKAGALQFGVNVRGGDAAERLARDLIKAIADLTDGLVFNMGGGLLDSDAEILEPADLESATA